MLEQPFFLTRDCDGDVRYVKNYRAGGNKKVHEMKQAGWVGVPRRTNKIFNRKGEMTKGMALKAAS